MKVGDLVGRYGRSIKFGLILSRIGIVYKTEIRRPWGGEYVTVLWSDRVKRPPVNVKSLVVISESR